MAEVTTDPSHRSKLVAGKTLVTEEMVAALEVQIDDLISRVSMPTEFVVPGSNRASAALDLSRTVVRRAERLLVSSPDRGLAGRALPEPTVRPAVGAGPLGRGRGAPAGPGRPPTAGQRPTRRAGTGS